METNIKKHPDRPVTIFRCKAYFFFFFFLFLSEQAGGERDLKPHNKKEEKKVVIPANRYLLQYKYHKRKSKGSSFGTGDKLPEPVEARKTPLLPG